MKKIFALIIATIICFIYTGECSAEKVLVKHIYYKGEYTGKDLCIDTSGVKIRRIQNTRKNAVRHGKEWGEPQYALTVKAGELYPDTGKFKYTIYIFFKANDSKWCYGTIDDQHLTLTRVSIWGGTLVHQPYLEDIINILNKASEYGDVDSMPNTEAEVMAPNAPHMYEFKK